MRAYLLVPLVVPLTAPVACAAPPPEFEAPTQLLPDLGAPSPWDELPEPDRGPAPPQDDTTDPGTSAGGSDTATTTGEGRPVDLGGLRLTEVLADPEGKDGDPWSPEIIEVLNVGDEALPIADLIILARGWPRLSTDELGLADEHLGPGERLVLYRYADLEAAPWTGVFYEPGILEVHFETAAGLRNGDGAVLLIGPGEEAVDALIYGGDPPASHDFDGAWEGVPAGEPVSGFSWCRTQPFFDSDSAEDWALCVPSPGELEPEPDSTTGDSTTGDGTGGTTDGTTGEPPGEATLVITEVLSNAPGPSSQERELEYIEILNLGPDDVDLAGWSIADSEDIDAPGRDPLLYREGSSGCSPESCLAVGERALIVGGAFIGPTGGAMVFETDDSNLADGGLTAHEPVVLRDADETIASTYRAWPDAFAEPYPVDIELPAHRLTPEADDEPAQWELAEASPGVP
jgi:hypothetical protein